MKFFFARFSLAKSLLALVVSLALILSAPILAFASPSKSSSPVRSKAAQVDASSSELKLTSATATAVPGGVLLQWTTNSTPDNVGFNIYRVKDGQRTRANREIIPGAMFKFGPPALMLGGYSYAWFDRGGSANSIYVIESVSVDGSAKAHQPINAVASKTAPGFENIPEALNGPESTDHFERYFPAAESQLNSPLPGAIEEQWVIAGQTGLKIAIKKDGWYRVTQQQMVAAGFNPTVDIKNLRLFVDANEVAIATNQLTGPFRSGDYIEFYGSGLDTPTTDTRIYYLIAGTTPGKRVTGEIQLDSPPVDPPAPPPGPASTPPPTPATSPIAPTSSAPVLRDPIFNSANIGWLMNTNTRDSIESQSPSIPLDRAATVNSSAPQPLPDYSQPDSQADNSQARATYPINEEPAKQLARVESPGKHEVVPGLSAAQPITTPAKVVSAAPQAGPKQGRVRKRATSRKKGKRKLRRTSRREYSHALAADGFAVTNFDNVFQVKDRTHYLSSLTNSEAENFFGAVVLAPVTLNLPLPNPDTTAVGPATLEFALQGILNTLTGAPHQVSVAFNGVTVGALVDFTALEHAVRSVSIPAAQLNLSGTNTVTFTKTSTGEILLIDYVRITYPHVFKADSGSFKFSLRGTQTRTVDGFATPLVRLIDYTDPLNVGISKPTSAATASGYAITVPTSESSGKSQRLLYAIPQGQFDQPAAISLNQPSTLNLNSNTADYLIVTHKNFIANLEPLRLARSSGMIARTVDVADIYDEFSYGVHGPQAIKSFLEHAATNWITPPRYVVFAGDASLDPRNYENLGDFDFVPTKLIDTSFEETCSDDWLADFDNDGIADIPIGRLPVRTTADVDLLINKIINFTPPAPQSALLVADDPTGYYFNFETANDQVANLLPPAMTVQKSYRRLEMKVLTGTISTNSGSTTVTGTGTLFTNQNEVTTGTAIAKDTGEILGTVAGASNDTSLTLTSNATSTYSGIYKRQDNATATANITAGFNQGRALANYSGHGNIDVWTSASIFTTANALALTNSGKLSFIVVMDCLNGAFQDPLVLSMSEGFLKAQGGAVAAFASSGKTFPEGQHEMSTLLYSLIYSGPPIALGDAIKTAKGATTDLDVRRTWVFFGDPSLKIR